MKPSWVVVIAVWLIHAPAAQAVDSADVEGEKASWHGFNRYDFVMDEQTLAIKPLAVATDKEAGGVGRARCILVVPKRPASGNPWSCATSTGIISRRPRPSCSRGGSMWLLSLPGHPGSGMPGWPS